MVNGYGPCGSAAPASVTTYFAIATIPVSEVVFNTLPARKAESIANVSHLPRYSFPFFPS